MIVANMDILRKGWLMPAPGSEHQREMDPQVRVGLARAAAIDSVDAELDGCHSDLIED